MCKRKWQWFHEIVPFCCNNVNCVVICSSLCFNMYHIYTMTWSTHSFSPMKDLWNEINSILLKLEGDTRIKY
jgi:hypothetical protein